MSRKLFNWPAEGLARPLHLHLHLHLHPLHLHLRPDALRHPRLLRVVLRLLRGLPAASAAPAPAAGRAAAPAPAAGRAAAPALMAGERPAAARRQPPPPPPPPRAPSTTSAATMRKDVVLREKKDRSDEYRKSHYTCHVVTFYWL